MNEVLAVYGIYSSKVSHITQKNRAFEHLIKVHNSQPKTSTRDLAEWFIGVPFKVNTLAIEKIANIKKHYKVGILSNGEPTRVEDVKKLNVEFNDILISYQLGSRKPEPEIFKIAINRANIEAQCLALVDDLAENRLAALDAGFGAVYDLEEFLDLSVVDNA